MENLLKNDGIKLNYKVNDNPSMGEKILFGIPLYIQKFYRKRI